MHHLSGPHPGPPPICFNCSQEGHFVVDCPESKRSTISGPPPGAAPGPNPPNGIFSGSPASQWSSSQNMSTPTYFSKLPPVVTKFAVPTQFPQHGNFSPAHGPSLAPPYQHPGFVPPTSSQSYFPPQGAYQHPQFQNSAPSYPHSSSLQSYSAPSPNAQYGQGYQAPQNQYPSSSVPQYNGSPASYGPPAVQFQSPVRQFTSRSNSYTGPPPPQWTNTVPVSASSPFTARPHQDLNQQRQESGGRRNDSATHSQQPQPTSQDDYGTNSDVPQQILQTPNPGFNVTELHQISAGSPVNEPGSPKLDTESVPSSRASTPYGRYGTTSSTSGSKGAAFLSIQSSPATPTVHTIDPYPLAEVAKWEEAPKAVAKKDTDEPGEEGEYTEDDLLQEQFNWDFKKIFKEPTPTEHVALSQPLSYTYTVTPVPLMDPRWAGSVSRYARKENLKEYLKPIRTQPQWHYLKEDPAFSDVKLEGPLIPIKGLREWMAHRHGIGESPKPVDEAMTKGVNEEPAVSRKRTWSDEQEDIDNQIQLEASIEQSIEQPKKRQKNEAIEAVEEDCALDAPVTPAPGTPTIGRSGTPTFGVPDDVWAPEPGEAASTPMDPTEALLASLGVSGSPKPVLEESNSATMDDQHATPPFGNIPQSLSPQIHASINGTPHNNSVPAMPQGSQVSLEGPSPNRPGYGNPQYNNHLQGSPLNGTPYGAPTANVQYPDHGVPVYSNNMPSHSSASYGPPQQHYGTTYSQPPPPRQPSSSNHQYGALQGQFPLQSHYLPPQNHYPPQPPYIAPPSNQYGLPQPHWNPQMQVQYNGPPQYGPPQGQYDPAQIGYGGPPQSQYGPQQGPYGGPSHGQWSQPQNQYGPPHSQYTTIHPSNQGPPQYGTSSYPPHSNHQYSNAPNQGNPPDQQSNNQGPQPPRHDSGYASARGSYSNDSGHNVSNGFSNVVPTEQAQQAAKNNQNNQPPVGGDQALSTESVSKKEDVKADVNLEIEDVKASEPESPLSPTSAEILGKLTQPSKPRKIIRVISGKNKNQTDDAVKKLKRPAPVIAEAYSRRW